MKTVSSTKDSKGNRGSRRFSGYGKALDSPSTGTEKLVRGEKDRQAEQNRSKSVDPDADYAGNVTGMYSTPVRLK